MSADFGIDLEASRAADQAMAAYWASQPRRPLPAGTRRRTEAEWREDLPRVRPSEDLTPTR